MHISRLFSFLFFPSRPLPQTTLLKGQFRQGDVRKNTSLEELHDVEGRADHGHVLTQGVDLGHGHVRVLAQGLEDPELALDSVRGRGQQRARGLFAEDIARVAILLK